MVMSRPATDDDVRRGLDLIDVEHHGSELTVFVDREGGVDLDALSVWAAGELTAYKRPRLVYRVDELPRNLLGKVVKGPLAPPG